MKPSLWELRKSERNAQTKSSNTPSDWCNLWPGGIIGHHLFENIAFSTVTAKRTHRQRKMLKSFLKMKPFLWMSTMFMFDASCLTSREQMAPSCEKFLMITDFESCYVIVILISFFYL